MPVGDTTQVLVVDDEPVITAAMELVLCRAFHGVVTAWNYGEGLRLADALPNLDLAIVDLGLPDGQGADLVSALWARWANLPVIISTGYDGSAVTLGGAEAGRRQDQITVLPKPWTESELLTAVDRALARGSP